MDVHPAGFEPRVLHARLFNFLSLEPPRQPTASKLWLWAKTIFFIFPQSCFKAIPMNKSAPAVEKISAQWGFQKRSFQLGGCYYKLAGIANYDCSIVFMQSVLLHLAIGYWDPGNHLYASLIKASKCLNPLSVSINTVTSQAAWLWLSPPLGFSLNECTDTIKREVKNTER